MKELKRFLDIMVGSFMGTFLTRTYYDYRDYRRSPELYAERPKPWYWYGTVQSFLMVVGIVILNGTVKLVLRRLEPKEEEA